MCGRFTEISAAEKITKKLQLKRVSLTHHRSRYNIAPSQPVLVIVSDPQKKMEVMQWGFVPSWSKDPAIGHRMINARAETLAEKPSFRGPFKTSRCLIPSDGFYESCWHTPVTPEN